LRQGAAGQIQDGTTSLARTLEAAARQAGAELRADTRVSSIIVEKRRAIGVIVEGGEMIPAKAVLSSLDARETLLRLVQAGSLGFGTATSVPDRQRVATAQILLALSGPPPFAGVEPQNLRARFVIAPRPETAFANELAMEMTVPTATDPALAPGGGHVVSALVPYLPREVAGGWEAAGALLRKRVLATLETFAPGLKDRVVAHRVITPDDASFGDGVTDQRFPLSRLLASYEARIRTPIDQLYLCGGNAEPVNAVSGRAGRLAAGFVFMARNP
jgi:phytoene dehydrogenase-like protein